MTKVLIVDDEMLMRKGLCTLIDWAALDCEVIGTAENGLRAKQVITSIQPNIKKVRLQRSAFTELVYAGLGKRSDALEKQMFTLMVSNKQM